MGDARRDRTAGERRDPALPGDDTNPRLAAFLRGVTIGAMVGAAIAGSALWERTIRRRAAEADRDRSAGGDRSGGGDRGGREEDAPHS